MSIYFAERETLKTPYLLHHMNFSGSCSVCCPTLGFFSLTTTYQAFNTFKTYNNHGEGGSSSHGPMSGPRRNKAQFLIVISWTGHYASTDTATVHTKKK